MRAAPRERRSFPRPPLWLNLLLLLIAAATFGYVRYQRAAIDAKTAALFRPSENSPEEIQQLRQELAQTDLTRNQVARELDARLQFLHVMESNQFYLTIDTTRRKIEFRIGKSVARDADVQIGESRTISAPDGRKWTFLPLKGSFSVQAKVTDYPWPVPDWVYAADGRTPPPSRAVVPDGLGKYVLVLPNNTVIESPPPADSPLHGAPKPGSYMVPEDFLAAIWPRITKYMPVYVY